MTTERDAERAAKWRRAYIDTARRSQPISELERKAAKAKRRHLVAAEVIDLSFAKNAAWNRKALETFILGGFCPLNYCSHCSAVGRGPFNEQTKRYAQPPVHKPRCTYGADWGVPYPGWSAVASPIPDTKDQPHAG